MIEIHTKNVAAALKEHGTADVALWVYNGFDVMIPLDLVKAIEPKMGRDQEAFNRFEHALRGPALSMMLEGVKVNMSEVSAQMDHFEEQERVLEAYVQSLTIAIWPREHGLNVESPDQMKDFFYTEEGFNLTPQYIGQGNSRRVTCNREALEKIAKSNYYAQPVVLAILELKDVHKRLQFLRRGIDPDGRVRCSFNVAATETGRWSSSQNPFNRGGNFQNQTEEVRKIYSPDTGWIFAYPDLEQAESRSVGYYSGDRNYISALETSDLHTAVAKMVWPELEWPNDNGSQDRQFADQPFYRHFTRRDLSKRGGHATNYLGKPFTVSRALNVEQPLIEEFQSRYWNQFGDIRKWHGEVQRELAENGVLCSALGRKRTFFGRLQAEDTLKEAVAYLNQELISTILKIGFYRTWATYQIIEKPLVKLIGDVHDGCVMQLRTTRLDDLAENIISMMTIPVRMPHGVMTIPVDFTVGWRWQKKEMVKWRRGVLSELGEAPDEHDAFLEMAASDVRGGKAPKRLA